MNLSKTLSFVFFCSNCFYRSDVDHLCFLGQTGYSCIQIVVSAALNVSSSIRSYIGVFTWSGRKNKFLRQSASVFLGQRNLFWYRL